MSEFRGSRRLMARIRERDRVRSVNRTRPIITPEEAEEIARLDQEARSSFAPSGPRLVKQALKQQP